MTVLNSVAQVKKPESFTSEIGKVTVSSAEVKLTKTLFDAFRQDEADLSDFKEEYNERLHDLIDAKVKGREVVMPTADAEPDVINLMDALKKSVAQAKSNLGRKPSASSRGSGSKPAAAKSSPKHKSRTA
jgi:DNA end-binding protein Ku